MPEVQEVFRMATQKVRPDEGFVDRQQAQQRRRARNRKLGAIGLVAVIGVAAAVFAIQLAGEEDRSQPATQPPEAVVPDGAYTIDLNTGEMTPLPESLAGGWSYQVSPTGTMFAYNLCCTGPGYVANVDGTGLRTISPVGVDALGPSWSPDGTLLVYQGRTEGTDDVGNLYLVDVDTEKVQRITDLELRRASWWYLNPIFTPDGARIIFQMPRGPSDDTRWDLWSVPVSGGEPTIVRGDAAMGVYSPDGLTLAYLDAPRENGDGWSSSLWLAARRSPSPKLLVDGNFDFLRWSPDGTRIVYAGDGQIHVVDVATGETSRVADGGTAEWLDDDTLVVSPAGVTD